MLSVGGVEGVGEGWGGGWWVGLYVSYLVVVVVGQAVAVKSHPPPLENTVPAQTREEATLERDVPPSPPPRLSEQLTTVVVHFIIFKYVLFLN